MYGIGAYFAIWDAIKNARLTPQLAASFKLAASYSSYSTTNLLAFDAPYSAEKVLMD
jgi:hypothetical protein